MLGTVEVNGRSGGLGRCVAEAGNWGCEWQKRGAKEVGGGLGTCVPEEGDWGGRCLKRGTEELDVRSAGLGSRGRVVGLQLQVQTLLS